MTKEEQIRQIEEIERALAYIAWLNTGTKAGARFLDARDVLEGALIELKGMRENN